MESFLALVVVISNSLAILNCVALGRLNDPLTSSIDRTLLPTDSS